MRREVPSSRPESSGRRASGAILAGDAIITLTNGESFLSESRVGPGRLLLFGVEAGTEWSDLPLKGSLRRSCIGASRISPPIPMTTLLKRGSHCTSHSPPTARAPGPSSSHRTRRVHRASPEHSLRRGDRERSREFPGPPHGHSYPFEGPRGRHHPHRSSSGRHG
ncbi:MAG: hypothetical protein MZV64_29655 [Ignavibacteriales bacterium]|nr:hypothetical protein [Ignavibacteriales bacterium]